MQSVFGKNNAFKILWELISPLIIYYAGYYLGYYMIAMILSANRMTELPDYINPLVGGICMLCGVIALSGEIRQECRFCKTDRKYTLCNIVEKNKILSCVLLLTSAISLVVIMNFLMGLSGMTNASESYQKVASSQYSVPLWMGIVLYGMVSPFAEEMVFRHVIFNKLLRTSGRVAYGMVVSAFLFGIYHGNIVQGTYAFLMGLFLAYVQYGFGKVWAPVLCHGVGNTVIFLCSTQEKLYNIVFHPIMLIIWSAFLIGTGIFVYKDFKKKQ